MTALWRALLPVLVWLLPGPAASADALPPGFVFLRSVDPTIVQDIRYAGTNNFTDSAVPGYAAAECVLVENAAIALSKVQAELMDRGLSLVIYDCYRPARAVAYFVRWAEGNSDRNPVYHPDIEARDLIAKGYVAARSSHSSGGTVDLTITAIGAARPLPMGTPFDFFGPASHTRAPGQTEAARRNRDFLVATMARFGFENYRKEWWHYSYPAAPFRGRQFDFAIPPYDGE